MSTVHYSQELLTMDDRTYPVTPVTHDALRAENERLRAELGQCASENNQLTENAAELGKALDLALAERDALRAELDAMRRAHSVIAARMDAMGC